MPLYFAKEFNILWLPVIHRNYILFGGNRMFLLTCLHYLQVLIHSKPLTTELCEKLPFCFEPELFFSQEQRNEKCLKVF